jgi:hypothetical protein
VTSPADPSGVRLVAASRLRATLAGVLQGLDVPEGDASTVAELLVEADLAILGASFSTLTSNSPE